jgi:tetratricopeptide (TPR) repeat protein
VSEFGVREVERLLGISRSAIHGLIRAGFVSPKRGARREYRFSFQDLILLRTARALSAAKVPPGRITRSLKALRRRLPETVPLSGLRICAVGDRVIVTEGRRRWHADSGQYLLDLDVNVEGGELSVQARDAGSGEARAERWFQRGAELEDGLSGTARAAYERALALDPGHAAARINLGRLLHEAGELQAAESVYREGVTRAGNDAVLLFNLGVLLEDMRRPAEAIAAYESALRADPRFADCHYNLALAYEAAGNAQGAIRHMGEYRKLARRNGR